MKNLRDGGPVFEPFIGDITHYYIKLLNKKYSKYTLSNLKSIFKLSLNETKNIFIYSKDGHSEIKILPFLRDTEPGQKLVKDLTLHLDGKNMASRIRQVAYLFQRSGKFGKALAGYQFKVFSDFFKIDETELFNFTANLIKKYYDEKSFVSWKIRNNKFKLSASSKSINFLENTIDDFKEISHLKGTIKINVNDNLKTYKIEKNKKGNQIIKAFDSILISIID